MRQTAKSDIGQTGELIKIQWLDFQVASALKLGKDVLNCPALLWQRSDRPALPRCAAG